MPSFRLVLHCYHKLNCRAYWRIQTKVLNHHWPDEILSFPSSEPQPNLSSSGVPHSIIPVCNHLPCLRTHWRLHSQVFFFCWFNKLFTLKLWESQPDLPGSRVPHSDIPVSNPRLFFSEPIGGTIPKFSGMAHLTGLMGQFHRPLTLPCPAQGSPTPTFRCVTFLRSNPRVIWFIWRVNSLNYHLPTITLTLRHSIRLRTKFVPCGRTQNEQLEVLHKEYHCC